MSTSKSYDIVLLPPADVNNYAIKLSNQLSSSFDSHFVLDGKTRYPHVTLYITLARLKAESDVQKALGTLGKNGSLPLAFTTAALGLLSDHGTVVDLIEKYNLA